MLPGTRRSARRSLQKFAYAENDNDDNDPKSLSDSELSTPPLSSDSDCAEEVSSVKSRQGKRKRDAMDIPATASSTETSLSKRSPRKAPKIEKQSIKQENVKFKAKRQPVKKVKTEEGAVVQDPPPNWEEIWDVTAEMRERVLAVSTEDIN